MCLNFTENSVKPLLFSSVITFDSINRMYIRYFNYCKQKIWVNQRQWQYTGISSDSLLKIFSLLRQEGHRLANILHPWHSLQYHPSTSMHSYYEVSLLVSLLSTIISSPDTALNIQSGMLLLLQKCHMKVTQSN